MATPLLGIALLLFTACGGDDGGVTSGVASLEDVAAADEPSTEGTDAALEADEAALEFSQCMRDEGLDFPDIGVDAEGNPALRSSFQDADIDPRSEAFRSAMDTCGDILQAAGFGGGRGAAFDDPAIQDAFVAYSECLRDEGLDVGDLSLGSGPGTGAAPNGDAPERGQGQGQGGFGNREDRIASQLGINPEDPEVAAALDTCGPILDETLAQVGAGRPANS